MDESLNVLDLERRVLIEVAATVEKEMWEVDFWTGKKVEGMSHTYSTYCTVLVGKLMDIAQ